MKRFLLCLAAVFGFAFFAPAVSAASPVAPQTSVAKDSLVTKIRGCHRHVRGKRYPHYHRGHRCRRVNVRRHHRSGRVYRRHCHYGRCHRHRYRGAHRHKGYYGRGRGRVGIYFTF